MLVTVNGNHFGNNSIDTIFTVGNQICSILSLTDSQLKCQLNGLSLGPQITQLNIAGYFDLISF